MPEIISNSMYPVWARLSNLTERHFWYLDEEHYSIEGGLQAMKFVDPAQQKRVRVLFDKEAQGAGQGVNWQHDRNLYNHQGKPMKRGSDELESFVSGMFDAAYEGDASFAPDLLATGHEELRHSIGKANQLRTVLTRNDLYANVGRLRDRAHREEVMRMDKIVCDSLR
jgi:hypothetical protein